MFLDVLTNIVANGLGWSLLRWFHCFIEASSKVSTNLDNPYTAWNSYFENAKLDLKFWQDVMARLYLNKL